MHALLTIHPRECSACTSASEWQRRDALSNSSTHAHNGWWQNIWRRRRLGVRLHFGASGCARTCSRPLVRSGRRSEIKERARVQDALSPPHKHILCACRGHREMTAVESDARPRRAPSKFTSNFMWCTRANLRWKSVLGHCQSYAWLACARAQVMDLNGCKARWTSMLQTSAAVVSRCAKVFSCTV